MWRGPAEPTSNPSWMHGIGNGISSVKRYQAQPCLHQLDLSQPNPAMEKKKTLEVFFIFLHCSNLSLSQPHALPLSSPPTHSPFSPLSFTLTWCFESHKSCWRAQDLPKQALNWKAFCSDKNSENSNARRGMQVRLHN